jgi:TolA-binding protein
VLVDRMRRCLLIGTLLVSLFSVVDASDFERAIYAYEDEDYVIARMYLESVLGDQTAAQFHRDALYYLVRIYEQEGDFLDFFDSAHRFIKEYPHDTRASDILRALLEGLFDRQSYVLAVDFAREYEHLIRDDSILQELGYGLLEQGEQGLADSIFALCTQTDTIKVIRSFLIDDYGARERMFKNLETGLRDLYLAENYLLMGDTVDAFLAFQRLDHQDLLDGALYRYSKIALYFNRNIAWVCAERMERNRQYKNKAKLIKALARCHKDIKIKPSDDEEFQLFMGICDLDTVSTLPPRDLMLDSLLAGAVDTTVFLQNLREQYGHTYYLDSLYCDRLIRLGRYDDAVRAVTPYIEYCNAHDYVCKVLGMRDFGVGDYRRAAEHLIVSGYRTPSVQYVLGECLRHMDYEAGDFYEAAMAETADSVLYQKALAGFIMDRYDAGDFQTVCSLRAIDLPNDTSLMRLYLRSLARCGKRVFVDSLLEARALEADSVILNNYGLYLMDQEKFAAAGFYFDSLMQNMVGGSDESYYNWALTSFLNNDMETARQRFVSYLTEYPNGERLPDVFFKIATLNYLQENYDTAAYYYGLASADSDLVIDALRNQLISHKKAGDWPAVISVGQKMLASGLDFDRADIYFDIGYAFLRAGKVRQAIENLVTASRHRSDPRFYYWLGEAYLSKGDFARALYSYRKVIDQHADDDMWVPTAQYKTGIVLELMDETEAARAVYEKIIRQKGVADPIGAEAQIRLRELEP